MNQTKQLVASIIEGDTQKANELFKSVITTKIASQVELTRVKVASEFLNPIKK